MALMIIFNTNIGNGFRTKKASTGRRHATSSLHVLEIIEKHRLILECSTEEHA